MQGLDNVQDTQVLDLITLVEQCVNNECEAQHYSVHVFAVPIWLKEGVGILSVLRFFFFSQNNLPKVLKKFLISCTSSSFCNSHTILREHYSRLP